MEYELIRSSRKTIAVQIRQGTVTVRAPRRTPLWQIEAFLQERRAWLEKHLTASQQKQQEGPPKEQDTTKEYSEKPDEMIREGGFEPFRKNPHIAMSRSGQGTTATVMGPVDCNSQIT